MAGGTGPITGSKHYDHPRVITRQILAWEGHSLVAPLLWCEIDMHIVLIVSVMTLEALVAGHQFVYRVKD